MGSCSVLFNLKHVLLFPCLILRLAVKSLYASELMFKVHAPGMSADVQKVITLELASLAIPHTVIIIVVCLKKARLPQGSSVYKTSVRKVQPTMELTIP